MKRKFVIFQKYLHGGGLACTCSCKSFYSITYFNDSRMPAEDRRTMGRRQYPRVDIVKVKERD
jgi:hypothetical protein